MKLNWRHKAGLFLTLVAVGCGLFLECSAKQAAGITLLGIAFAWLIGSLRQRAFVVTSAILICAVGLYVAVAPVWSDWNSVRNSAAQYDSAIADLQSKVKVPQIIADPDFAKLSASDQQAVLSEFDPNFAKVSADEFLYILTAIQKSTAGQQTRNVKIPDSAKQWVRPEMRSKADAGITLSPKDMSDPELIEGLKKYLLLPRPSFSFATALRAHAWNVFGGLALFISGLSILGWLFRRTGQFGRGATAGNRCI